MGGVEEFPNSLAGKFVLVGLQQSERAGCPEILEELLNCAKKTVQC
jgi:hypothetical protein